MYVGFTRGFTSICGLYSVCTLDVPGLGGVFNGVYSACTRVLRGYVSILSICPDMQRVHLVRCRLRMYSSITTVTRLKPGCVGYVYLVVFSLDVLGIYPDM